MKRVPLSTGKVLIGLNAYPKRSPEYASWFFKTPKPRRRRCLLCFALHIALGAGFLYMVAAVLRQVVN